MIVVDSSIWIDHVRRPEPHLMHLIETSQILMHPMVFGEVAMGSMEQRTEVLKSLRRFDRPLIARDAEVLDFIGARRLFGRGIGFIDAHLLVSTRITPRRPALVEGSPSRNDGSRTESRIPRRL